MKKGAKLNKPRRDLAPGHHGPLPGSASVDSFYGDPEAARREAELEQQKRNGGASAGAGAGNDARQNHHRRHPLASNSSDARNDDDEGGSSRSNSRSREGSRSRSRSRGRAPPEEALTEVHNPNRNPNAKALGDEPVELSRREREAQDRAAAQAKYWKLHKEGKTEQAKADLARLAIIRAEREEAARKRLAEQDAKKSGGARTSPAPGAAAAKTKTSSPSPVRRPGGKRV